MNSPAHFAPADTESAKTAERDFALCAEQIGEAFQESINGTSDGSLGLRGPECNGFNELGFRHIQKYLRPACSELLLDKKVSSRAVMCWVCEEFVKSK